MNEDELVINESDLLLEQILDTNKEILDYLTIEEQTEEIIEKELLKEDNLFQGFEPYWAITTGILLGYIFLKGAFDIWKK